MYIIYSNTKCISLPDLSDTLTHVKLINHVRLILINICKYKWLVWNMTGCYVLNPTHCELITLLFLDTRGLKQSDD